MRADDLMDNSVVPFGAPRQPFRIDKQGDIVDADGWLVCRPARGLWHDDEAHARGVCDALNAYPRPSYPNQRG